MIVLEIIPIIYVWKNNQAISFILNDYFIVGYLAKYQTHILDVDHPYSEPLYLPVTVSFFCVCVVSLCVRAVCLCPSCVWGVCLCLSWCSSRVSVSLNVRVVCLCPSLCWSRVSVSLLVLEPCVCVSLSEVRAKSTHSSSLTSDHLLNLTTHPHFFYNEKKSTFHLSQAYCFSQTALTILQSVQSTVQWSANS